MALPNTVHAVLATILLFLATIRAVLSSRTFQQRPFYRRLDATFSAMLVAFLAAVVALRWSQYPLLG